MRDRANPDAPIDMIAVVAVVNAVAVIRKLYYLFNIQAFVVLLHLCLYRPLAFLLSYINAFRTLESQIVQIVDASIKYLHRRKCNSLPLP